MLPLKARQALLNVRHLDCLHVRVDKLPELGRLGGQGLGRVHAADGREVGSEALALDALFVWSTMHGLAGILNGTAVSTLDLPRSLLAATPGFALARIGAALATAPPEITDE